MEAATVDALKAIANGECETLGAAESLAARALADQWEAGALTGPERLAVRQAAAGCISGTLAEWPLLVSAFRKSGLVIPETIGAPAVKALARFLEGRE